MGEYDPRSSRASSRARRRPHTGRNQCHVQAWDIRTRWRFRSRGDRCASGQKLDRQEASERLRDAAVSIIARALSAAPEPWLRSCYVRNTQPAGPCEFNIGEANMENDLNTRRPLDDRRRGIGGGMIAAIIAVLLVAGALLTWAPWNNGGDTASNKSSSTTTGSTSSTRPAANPAPTSGGNR